MRQNDYMVTPGVVRSTARQALQRAVPVKNYGRLVSAKRLLELLLLVAALRSSLSAIVRRFPLGPILAITPFNFPLNLVAHKLAPAIAAGCPTSLRANATPMSLVGLLVDRVRMRIDRSLTQLWSYSCSQDRFLCRKSAVLRPFRSGVCGEE